MNAMLNLSSEIASAEHAGDVNLLAAICRQLLLERTGGKPIVLKPTAPTKPTKAPAIADEELLTMTERKALGLPLERKTKFKRDGAYRWVLIEFANGYRQLTGMYPREKNPESLAPAMASARARYLLMLQGGRFFDQNTVLRAAKRLPKITGARVVSNPVELEDLRYRCLDMRTALEAFTPGFDDLTPEARSMVNRREAEQLEEAA